MESPYSSLSLSPTDQTLGIHCTSRWIISSSTDPFSLVEVQFLTSRPSNSFFPVAKQDDCTFKMLSDGTDG